MGKQFVAIFVFISVFTSALFAQEQELLAQKRLLLFSEDMNLVLEKTESDIKAFADNFEVRLDKGSKIVSPQVVSGSVLEPVLNVSIRKCVAIFCQTIDLDAAFKLTILDGQPNANCARNYLLIVNFQRSSSMLSELYESMNTSICINKKSEGIFDTTLSIALVHAENYSSGMVQRKAFELISLQPAAILESFKKVMQLNGVTKIQELQ